MTRPVEPLKLFPLSQYVGVNRADPIRFYYWPVLGRLYRRRVELCLAECGGGDRVLEVGFGSGVTFPTLAGRYREIHGLDFTADVAAVAAMFAGRGIRTDLRNGSVLAMPYPDGHFDTVLLISILEHLRPAEQPAAFAEIARVLRPGGRVVYGVPVERPLMVWAFRGLGYDIRQHHFSTHDDVSTAARAEPRLGDFRRTALRGPVPGLGSVYEACSLTRAADPGSVSADPL